MKGRSCAGRCNEADLGQSFDPARGVALKRARVTVGDGILLGFPPLEPEEEGAENFVADSDDGVLVTAPDDERLESRLEHRLGATGRMSKFAERAANIEIALADMACTCRPARYFRSRYRPRMPSDSHGEKPPCRCRFRRATWQHRSDRRRESFTAEPKGCARTQARRAIGRRITAS